MTLTQEELDEAGATLADRAHELAGAGAKPIDGIPLLFSAAFQLVARQDPGLHVIQLRKAFAAHLRRQAKLVSP